MVSKRFDMSRMIFTIVFAAISVFFLTPLFWMVSAASKFEQDVLIYPIQWIPTDWNLIGNFKQVWMGKIPFMMFYYNSIKLSIAMTFTTLLFSSMAAYAFTKIQFKGRDFSFGLLLSLMIIPAESTLVPRYLLLKWLGLYNSHAGLIILGMFSIYFTFLFRQFMLSIHNDYIEAAKIDGAGYWRVYWSIILPLSKPIVATVGIIKFIWSWNDYQAPLIFLISRKLYPIPLGMQLFRDDFTHNYAVVMMAALSAIVPLLIVFIILQKQVIKGISLGGVKG